MSSEFTPDYFSRRLHALMSSVMGFSVRVIKEQGTKC